MVYRSVTMLIWSERFVSLLTSDCLRVIFSKNFYSKGKVLSLYLTHFKSYPCTMYHTNHMLRLLNVHSYSSIVLGLIFVKLIALSESTMYVHSRLGSLPKLSPGIGALDELTMYVNLLTKTILSWNTCQYVVVVYRCVYSFIIPQLHSQCKLLGISTVKIYYQPVGEIILSIELTTLKHMKTTNVCADSSYNWKVFLMLCHCVVEKNKTKLVLS